MRRFILAIAIVILSVPFGVHADTIADLKAQIAQKNQEIQDLETQKAQYQQQLDATKQQGNTLRRQLSSIDADILDLNVTIKKTQTSIIETDLQIEELKNQIGLKQTEIDNSKSHLAYVLRELNTTDNADFLSLLFASRSFSDIFSQQEYLLNLQDQVHSSLGDLRTFKLQLETFKDDQQSEKNRLSALQDDLNNQSMIANNQRDDKAALVRQTQNQESKYQSLLASIAKQQSSTENQIGTLETKLRLAIDRSKLPTGSGILAWPLDSVYITQGYGTPNWNAAYTFHNGIDLRASIGTPVKASATGTVVGVGDDGRYAYGKWIAIDHGDLNITTLYGHLSLQKVKIGQAVSVDEVIGYSGNTGYTTGPHLHFSVFVSNSFTLLESASVKGVMIPVGATIDPTQYL